MAPSMSRGVSLLALVMLACGRPNPEAESRARKLDDPTELEAAASSKRPAAKAAWKREPPPMPESFAAFPRPDLAELDGIWVVDSEIPGERAVWVVEAEGGKLTIVDRRGRERILGVTLTSPCGLRLTDEYGRAHTRSFSLRDGQLFVTSKGAIAVAAPDGSLLACAGHRTYQIAADGRCRHTTEMLGVWSDPAKPSEICKLGRDDAGRVLTIGDQQLREHDGIWLDEQAAASKAERVTDRDAAVASLATDPATEPESDETETGGGPAATDESGEADR